MSKIEVLKRHTLTGHRDCVYTLQRSGNDNLFFSGAGDGMIVLWDLNSPDQGQLVAKLPNSVYALHYHSNSRLLVAGHNYDGVHLIDWENKKETGSLQLTTAAIFDIQSYGNHLFIATGDGDVTKVAVDSLTIETKVSLSSKSARTITVNERRGELVVGYSDNKIRVL